MTDAALAGVNDEVNLNLNVAAGYDSEVQSLIRGGNGYQTINVNSGGGGDNFLTSRRTMVSHLSMFLAVIPGNRWVGAGLGPLDTFDASAMSGGVDATFNGTGSATVIGGSGADHFTFPASAVDINVQARRRRPLYVPEYRW